jgi:hypothetical protein
MVREGELEEETVVTRSLCDTRAHQVSLRRVNQNIENEGIHGLGMQLGIKSKDGSESENGSQDAQGLRWKYLKSGGGVVGQE